MLFAPFLMTQTSPSAKKCIKNYLYIYLRGFCLYFNMSFFPEISLMAIWAFCAQTALANPLNEVTKKIRKEKLKKIFCGPSKISKIFHGPSIYIPKIFHAPTKTLQSLLLHTYIHVRSVRTTVLEIHLICISAPIFEHVIELQTWIYNFCNP